MSEGNSVILQPSHRSSKMSKRKREDNYSHLLEKIRKLERKVTRRRAILSSTDEEDSDALSSHHFFNKDDSAWEALGPDDRMASSDREESENHNSNLIEVPVEVHVQAENPMIVPNVPTTSADGAPVPVAEEENTAIALESDVLEILGEDPSAVKKYASGIHIEIATRFQHIATNGLKKEKRKELLAKYLTPDNCTHVGAPGLNPEIKAALPEASLKRDKGIETKQSQLASAISCLSEVISGQLKSKTKDNEMLSKLMDLGRLLCDVQHTDSVTRRNFIFFNLKKEMKDHLTSTKIDTLLFSESLPETLKSAKAVSKSGTDLKPGEKKTCKTATSKPLNRRAPAPARRPPGPPPRSREPAAPRAPPPPPPTQQPPRYYRTSSQCHPPPTRKWRQ